MTARIDVRIDELVLHGFAPGERGAIVESLSSELARLLAPGETAARASREFEAARPAEVGAGAARAIASEIAAQGSSG